MREVIRAAVDAAFEGYTQNAEFDCIKGEIAAAIEDRADEALRRGVVEKAALSKVLADFEKTLKKAPSGDRQKRLARIAGEYGVSPLGRSQALGRILASLLGLAGIMAFVAVLAAIGGMHRAVAAGAPFLAISCTLAVFLELTRYRVGRRPMAKLRAVPFAVLAGLLTGVFLGIVAWLIYKAV